MIEADGWRLDRQAGSHRQYRHPTKPGTVTVAGEPGSDLKPGALASVPQVSTLSERTFG